MNCMYRLELAQVTSEERKYFDMFCNIPEVVQSQRVPTNGGLYEIISHGESYMFNVLNTVDGFAPVKDPEIKTRPLPIRVIIAPTDDTREKVYKKAISVN